VGVQRHHLGLICLQAAEKAQETSADIQAVVRGLDQVEILTYMEQADQDIHTMAVDKVAAAFLAEVVLVFMQNLQILEHFKVMLVEEQAELEPQQVDTKEQMV
jgi:hypothetical protein